MSLYIHFHQQYMRIIISPRPCQYLLIFVTEVVSLWDFDYRFLKDYWYWPSFHMLIGHFHVFFGVAICVYRYPHEQALVAEAMVHNNIRSHYESPWGFSSTLSTGESILLPSPDLLLMVLTLLWCPHFLISFFFFFWASEWRRSRERKEER